MADESTYNNLRATTNSNNALSQQVAATSNTDSALDSEIKNTQNTMKQHKINKINLERMAEIKTYYSLKYRAINNLIKVFFLILIVVYLIISFFGLGGKYTKPFIIFIIIIGLAYMLYSYNDITRRDKRNFQEYDFGHPDQIEQKSARPRHCRIIKTDCDHQGDEFNKNKNDATAKTQNNMLDDK